jgi:hypothetical protein
MFAKLAKENEEHDDPFDYPKMVETPRKIKKSKLPQVEITLPGRGEVWTTPIRVIGQGKLIAWRYPDEAIGTVYLDEASRTGVYCGSPVSWRPAE